jgi:hypothetical protein
MFAAAATPGWFTAISTRLRHAPRRCRHAYVFVADAGFLFCQKLLRCATPLANISTSILTPIDIADYAASMPCH